MGRPKKLQILIEYDVESKVVTCTGPTSHPDVMVKMLAAALSQVGDVVAGMRKEQEKRPDIAIATPAISSKLGIKA